jgi:hypothetical protein
MDSPRDSTGTAALGTGALTVTRAESGVTRTVRHEAGSPAEYVHQFFRALDPEWVRRLSGPNARAEDPGSGSAGYSRRSTY